MNILNTSFSTPYETAPFSEITPEDFAIAIPIEVAKVKADIEAIATQMAPPNFENTLESLAFAGRQLDRITSMFFNLNSAETNDEIQGIAQEISPLLSELANDIRLNEALFQRIKAVYDQRDQLSLNSEQKMLLEKEYKAFTRNGALLSPEEKLRLREIDKKLSKLSLTFGENVLAETNKFQLHITDKNELSGLPEGALEAARSLAKDQNKEGWLFTLNYPSYIPFMTYADSRALRKKMWLAFGSKGFHNDPLDNQANVLEIARLRFERAQLLGYDNHAHFVLEERMAKSPEKVADFLEDLLEKAMPAARREFEALSNFAKKRDGIEQLQSWDGAYYTEKLKQERFDLDDEQLKPYFPLEKVVDGVFEIARRLFGLRFQEVTHLDTYHEEVKTYQVWNEHEDFIAIFYADFHPRPGKRNGAWMTSYKSQRIEQGTNERPHVSIVCNFTRPTESKPSLLTFNEVTTLFHEFGHALHGMLANTTYPNLSGTNVFWDFVELPSQLMENWCYEKEALQLFAHHYETGEPLPEDFIAKIKKAATFMQGMQTVRQISFGLLDMAWHGADPSTIEDVKAHEHSVFEDISLYPTNSDTCMSTAFSHIFQGGYSAGYYSYKWAEVLDADAYAFFKEKGVFNQEVANLFKLHVLSKGGTAPPMELYKRFRGKEPDAQALLERAGLLK